MTAHSSPPVDPDADGTAVGALLAGAVAGTPDADGERKALAAYRAARDSGALTAPPRRRDDWRTVASGPGGD
ncbi:MULTISPECIES: hypothetical protein [unclassified Streptomyces]|uniref:hypothetical protein n=1 Tax=unclassified Streptomyces TaxID=2593676 RepID=UPI003BB7AB8B